MKYAVKSSVNVIIRKSFKVRILLKFTFIVETH